MEGNKKIIIGVAVLIVVVLVGYYLWQGQGSPTDGTAQVETEQGTAAAPGASAVTEEGQVVTASGEVAKNDVVPGSAEAPQQSAPINEESAPAQSIKLNMSTGVAPSNFSVKAGEATTLVITSGDTFSHVFKFEDPSLQAVAVGLGPGETRLITFNAPSQKGEYKFFCDVPGHRSRGEEGVMTVN